jgi:asparaginyl-tRNA synthetase
MSFKFKYSFTPIKQLYEQAEKDFKSLEGTTHTVKGWIQFSRPQAKVMFLQISDGSHPVAFQLIYGDENDAVRKLVEPKAHVGACISATGIIVKSPAKGQLIEMKVTDSKVLGGIAEPSSFLPGVKGVPMEVVRPHQDIRTLFPVYRSIYRIRSKLSKCVHDYMELRGVYHLDPNVITKAGCEGGAQQFVITNLLKEGDVAKIPVIEKTDGKVTEKTTKVDFSKDFFLEQAFLTESSQLQLEALCRGIGPVYTTNPSFRAEPSKTRRHLCMFTHLEWELPFIDLKDLMDFSEDLVMYCFKRVLGECMADLKELEKTVSKGVIAKLESFVKEDFARISYDDAIDIITKNRLDVLKYFGDEMKEDIPKWGDDLGNFAERYLSEVHFKKPVFVYNYPLDLKSFYMKQNPEKIVTFEDGTTQVRKTCQGCDLLIPFLGELVGSSIREEDYKKLTDEIARRKMDITPLKWYCDIRQTGCGGTGGAGLGFDRLVTICCSGQKGLGIHDAVPFPVSFQDLKF